MAQTIIRWSPRAVSNFEDICNYIAKDSKFFASLFAQKVFSIIKSLPKFPKSGRMVPEYGNKGVKSFVICTNISYKRLDPLFGNGPLKATLLPLSVFTKHSK
ncbi:MAG: type II toxin-antitoxin system RelE/ParE family toxin [Nitrospirae bacterium]|nr:type II toxin-antitoxin system RelE/ParE family toxin [Nitrospirota bacterium]